MDYAQISKDVIAALYDSYEKLKESPLDQSLRILIELRVSQLNRCIYCCGFHTREAKNLGISDSKIAGLPQWKTSVLFSDAEKEALGWIESITQMTHEHTALETKLTDYFSAREIVDITACAAIMNALNRMTRLTSQKACDMSN
jgi:AhpD family alkylhydroperoxidase